ncbi:MAG: hypothetical protein FJW35_09085 [Acidobacteria bacterium]|nr:hypothetical protein [Acidobacteriota bacterium]
MDKRVLVRLCLLLVIPCAAGAVRPDPPADVSGAWDMTVQAGGETAEVALVLRQEGERLTGTYRGRMGETGLSGTVRDDRIGFSVTLRFRDIAFTVSYAGTVEGDRMTGTADFGDGRSGRWTARRRPAAATNCARAWIRRTASV